MHEFARTVESAVADRMGVADFGRSKQMEAAKRLQRKAFAIW